MLWCPSHCTAQPPRREQDLFKIKTFQVESLYTSTPMIRCEQFEQIVLVDMVAYRKGKHVSSVGIDIMMPMLLYSHYGSVEFHNL